MANVLKYQVAWSGWPGQPGLSTFYFAPSVTDFTPVRTFFEAIKSHLVNGTQYAYPSVCDVLDVDTGKVVGVQTVTSLSPTTSTATTQQYSGATGSMVRWITNGFVNGNRVAGRTFLIPLPSTEFNTSGSIATASQTAFQAAATALITAMNPGFLIYARPFPGRNEPGKPVIPARLGTVWPVQSSVVPNLAYVQRSRRA